MKNNSELKILNILNNYYGINKNQALFLCNKYGINLNKATNSNINPFILDLIKKTIKEYCIVDDRLSYLIEDNKNDKKINKTFTGMRLIQGLPCRGQRTRSNAKTSRRLR